MDDLITWLRIQLDEDERVARSATAGPWRHNPNKHWRKPGTTWFEEAVFAGPPGTDATCVAGTGETDDPQSMADAAHIARHDPARVLAEVDAKRRLLQQFELRGNSVRATVVPSTGGVWDDLLRMLALPYAGRPGYRAEWRP
ncbi:MAG TPA: DUF6221 family protein [Pilimelia sp.]|nr:DUF6221 family protein [Pilimelia sp.]